MLRAATSRAARATSRLALSHAAAPGDLPPHSAPRASGPMAAQQSVAWIRVHAGTPGTRTGPCAAQKAPCREKLAASGLQRH